MDITDNIPSNPPASGPPAATHGPIPPPLDLFRPPWSEQQPTTLDGPKVSKTMDFLKILKNHDFRRKI